jgi:hypothetical protein
LDVGRAFSFPFRDPDWVVKFLVGAVFVLLSVVLVGIPFLAGYMVEIVRRVAAGETEPLPAWENLGEKFGRGLVLAAIFIVYSLPYLVLSACAFLAGFGDNGGIRLIGTVVNCLGLLYSLFLTAISPAIIARFAAVGTFSSGFQIDALIDFAQRRLGDYVLVVVLTLVASVIGGLGLLICGVGVLFTSFYSTLIVGHLVGQLAREPAGQGETPVERPETI